MWQKLCVFKWKRISVDVVESKMLRILCLSFFHVTESRGRSAGLRQRRIQSSTSDPARGGGLRAGAADERAGGRAGESPAPPGGH